MSLLERALLKRHEDNRANPHVVTASQAAYESTISGFTPATAAAALDALAGVRISESGSNENGTYVRWEDGRQVCFGRIEWAHEVGEELYREEYLYYAAGFTDVPKVVHGATLLSPTTPTDWGAYSFIQRARSNDIYRAMVRLRNAGVNHTSVAFTYIAIGRWKE